jgi:hypothetical protein
MGCKHGIVTSVGVLMVLHVERILARRSQGVVVESRRRWRMRQKTLLDESGDDELCYR